MEDRQATKRCHSCGRKTQGAIDVGEGIVTYTFECRHCGAVDTNTRKVGTDLPPGVQPIDLTESA